MKIATQLIWWNTSEWVLEKTFVFQEFRDVILFMNDMIKFCEKNNHHPEWTNIYTKLYVTLRTHDEGNMVSKLDIALAEEMEKQYEKYRASPPTS